MALVVSGVETFSSAWQAQGHHVGPNIMVMTAH